MPVMLTCLGSVGNILYIVLLVGFGSRKPGRIKLDSTFGGDYKRYYKIILA